jgi:glycine betaine/choline ABC-type transport system substrate-binding protein
VRTDKTRWRALLAALAALALALGVAACGSSDDSTTSGSTESGGEAGAIHSNPENGKVNLTIGSKNFPEQEILGEIYAQALTAAGYKVKSALNLGSETVALKAVKGGQVSGYPEYASTALSPRRRHRGVGKSERRIRKRRSAGVRTDSVRQRQRSRDDQRDRRKI